MAIGTVLNGIGLIVLFKCKSSEIDLAQRYILVNLCFIDFCWSIFLAVFVANMYLGFLSFSAHKVIYTLIQTFKTGQCFAIFWLIIDRYLHIKLNIRYVIYWSKKKTIIAIILLWMLIVLAGILFAVYTSFFNTVLFAAFDSIILLFSSYVYAYALIMLKKGRANVRSNQRNNGIFKGLFTSVIILIAFTALVVIPNIIVSVLVVNRDFIFVEILWWYLWISSPLSFWIDALTYIFLSPKVRLALKRKLNYVFLGRVR